MARMRQLIEDPAPRTQIPDILRMVDEDDLAERFEDALTSEDLPEALGSDLGPICTALERAAITANLPISSPNVMDFATALRIYGPPEFQLGEPLEWDDSTPGILTAHDHRGTRWDISGGTGGVGVTVAWWDRPDWWVGSIEEAKRLVAEIVARPSFPRDAEGVAEIEIPVD